MKKPGDQVRRVRVDSQMHRRGEPLLKCEHKRAGFVFVGRDRLARAGFIEHILEDHRELCIRHRRAKAGGEDLFIAGGICIEKMADIMSTRFERRFSTCESLRAKHQKQKQNG